MPSNSSTFLNSPDNVLELWGGIDIDLMEEESMGVFNLSTQNGTLWQVDMESVGGHDGPSSSIRLLIHYMDVYIVPLIALVGLAGNLLSFIVFVFTYMRRLSSSIYLAALSVADSWFLICVLVSWGMNTGLDLYVQNGWCQTLVYLTYMSSFLSVWYVVAFTVERYIAVHFPLERQALCTPKRAKLVVVGLAIFAAVFYNFGTWTSGVTVIDLPMIKKQTMCAPLTEYMTLVNILNNIDTVTTLIVPFVAILVMNVKIAHRVAQFYRERKNTPVEECSTSSSNRTNNRVRVSTSSSTYYSTRQPRKKQAYTRTQVRVTKMLLIVSTIFLVLNLPRHTARTYIFVRTLTEKDFVVTQTYLVWDKVFQFLYYMHFSVNLFLYSVLGKNFRKASAWLCRRIRHSIIDYFSKCSQHCRLGTEYITGQGREVILYDLKIGAKDRRFV